VVEVIVRPYVYHLPDGIVSLEWPTRRKEVSAEIGPDGGVYVHCTHVGRMTGFGRYYGPGRAARARGWVLAQLLFGRRTRGSINPDS
jgi:hypothetical protein